MADPFKLSRKVNASVTCNLHTMEHYKLPLTKQRNATLGHPKQWQPYVQKPAKTMNPQEAQMAINKGNEDTIRDTASIVSHKYASDEVLLGKAKTDEMANMQHKSVNSER